MLFFTKWWWLISLVCVAISCLFFYVVDKMAKSKLVELREALRVVAWAFMIVGFFIVFVGFCVAGLPLRS